MQNARELLAADWCSRTVPMLCMSRLTCYPSLWQGGELPRSGSSSALRSVSRSEVPATELPLPPGVMARTVRVHVPV